MGRVCSLPCRAPRSSETGARAGPHRGHHAPTPYLAQGAWVRSWCRCPGVCVGACAPDSRAVIPTLECQGLKRLSKKKPLEVECHALRIRHPLLQLLNITYFKFRTTDKIKPGPAKLLKVTYNNVWDLFTGPAKFWLFGLCIM